METKKKKPYIPPKIIFETDLETKAGSPLDPGADEGEGINLFPGIDD